MNYSFAAFRLHWIGLQSPADAATYAQADAYAKHVGAALDELSECYDRLLATLLRLLIEASGETTRQTITSQAAAVDSDVLDADVRAFVLTLANDAVERDSDWIQAVATVLLRKAPAEWSDHDFARFRRELPQHMGAFHRLAALHTAPGANGTGPSRRLRVTFTRQDGSEHIGLVGLDEHQRRRANDVFHRILGELTRVVGSPQRAHAALLALLGERLLPPPATDRGAQVEVPEERNRND